MYTLRKSRHYPRLAAVLAAASLSLLLAGCSSNGGFSGQKPFAMGERVRVGPLTFSVLETTWKSQLGDLVTPKLPAKRFLVVKLSITNSGGAEAGVPFLTLEDSKGNSFREVSDGAGVPEWLGMLRRVVPAQTEQGNIVFDVPPGGYKLRLSDGAEPENTALVDLPFRMDDAPVAR